jgi:hypothetical protein
MYFPQNAQNWEDNGGNEDTVVTVKYFNLEDLRRSLHKEVELQWCVVENKDCTL